MNINLNQDLIKRVEDKLVDTLLLAQERLNIQLEIPRVTFNKTGHSTAGHASKWVWAININPEFLTRFPDEVVDRTVGHEVGHLLNYKLYPKAKQAHGPEFKYIMRRLGLPDTRCHSMVIVEKRPFSYSCGCATVQLSTIQHKRAAHAHAYFGKSRYGCRKCGRPFVFVGIKTEDFVNNQH